MTVTPAGGTPDGPKRPTLIGSMLPLMLFVLLCGVVGPIFLIIGLNTDGPDRNWLLPVGIGISALDLVIGFFVGRASYRSKLRRYYLKTQGRRGTARVLDFDETNVMVNNQPLVKLRLLIDVEGVTPFEVSASRVVSAVRIPALHQGSVPVLVDPETKHWDIDWEEVGPIVPSGRFSPPVPERSMEERLLELDDLLKRDLISREEYDAARARVLGG